MKNIPKVGDVKQHSFRVSEKDIAVFDGQVVHLVCSTFALAREIEWSSRLFVLEMKDDSEEGIGTMLAIDHKSPAMVNEQVIITARVSAMTGNELVCTIEAKVKDRIIAHGKTGQKIMNKERIESIFENIEGHDEERK